MNEYLANLDKKSAWVFTKQDTSFDESVKAARLLEFVCNSQDEINIESYFTAHHNDYDIATDRHRMLVIASFLGLSQRRHFTKGETTTKKNAPLKFLI